MNKKDLSRQLSILKSQWFLTAFNVYWNRKLKAFDWYTIYTKDTNGNEFLTLLSRGLLDTASGYYLRKHILHKIWIDFITD